MESEVFTQDDQVVSARAQETTSISEEHATIEIPWVKEKLKEFQHGGHVPGFSPRPLGITWQNLTVEAIASDASIHENFGSQFNIPKLIQEGRRKSPPKKILYNSHGCVKPGEMLLVLGRPGSGCTTLLRILSNKRHGYSSISGEVNYGALGAADADQYRGQVVMNEEEEIFFPSLTVKQTLDFATRLKSPPKTSGNSAPAVDYREQIRQFLLQIMKIEHTVDTKVGNEYVRGVSGGERKRVSILECMATRGAIFCWDNSTRGLDASTALEYIKAVRTLTDTLGIASIVTLYQAGNGIYDTFDKVLVLDQGRQIYYGRRAEAQSFMEGLGFVCQEGSNIADFLTGVTVSTERKVRPGYENRIPRNAQSLQEEYEKSDIYKRIITEYNYPKTDLAKTNTDQFKEVIAKERDIRLSDKSIFTVNFGSQVAACIRRQYQIVWGDKASFLIKQVSTLAQALIAGSLFYNAPPNSSGLFTKGGALFFSLLYNSLLAMSEVTDSFTGRPVLLKHKSFAYFHPAAFCIAQITADIPIVLFQVTIFAPVVYFMTGLTPTGSAFMTYWIIVVASTICMTALFRAIGAAAATFDAASKVSGLIISLTVMYNGYMITKPQMHPWFVWLFWIDPLAYGFDAILSNEFRGKTINCANDNLVPNGLGYNDTAHQSCAGVGGATQGMTYLSGEQYLYSLEYSPDHVWRNFGIIWAWWALFVGITVIATSHWRPSSDSGSSLVIPREKAKTHKAAHMDLEKQVPGDTQDTDSTPINSGNDTEKSPPAQNMVQKNLIRNTSVFTWKNLTYTVKTPSGDRVLLDNVQGWVKPGMLGALMGSSGAGKTTLLDVLAQRKTEGTIHGTVLVDGRPLPVSFQRSAGYCEQLDVHEPYATVREALEFSALLRQSQDVSREEKLRYVDVIIDLLELHNLADTLIGQVGAGLTVEQRKRVTIGVELVAKPSILIFLDEPTSGLDGQSAYNTVRFLRKLADVGQAVLVTIHQPSAQLFSQFDTLLLLAKGGKTVYFGEIGDNAQTVKDYFGNYGAVCPVETNPAEHMIDVVSGHLSQGRDWHKVWVESPEHAAVCEELDSIVSEAASKPSTVGLDTREFATSLWNQSRIVTHRMNISLYRNTDYINNKIMLHISSALINGFSFWMIGDTIGDLQMRLFTIFNFIFVAPGVIAQLQPLFIERRDIFESREKKSKMYSWIAFTTGLIVSEMPYLCICAVLYFVCWYYTVGFPSATDRAGATFFVVLIYEFVYTGIGQFIAAYAPNAVFAALVNPLVIGTLVSFCGVLVPYAHIQPFWRYWIYYMNPFNYLMGSLLVFDVWDTPVICAENEFAIFDPPATLTCAQYLKEYMTDIGPQINLVNPTATEGCKVCQYSNGSDYLKTLNLLDYSYGWRDAGIVVLFAFSSYALVYALMKLRTKTTKKAE